MLLRCTPLRYRATAQTHRHTEQSWQTWRHVQVMRHTWFPTCLWHPGLQTAAEERQDSPFSHAASHKVGLRHMHRTRRSVGFGMTHLLSPTQAHNIKAGIHAASLRAKAQVNAVPTSRTHASRMSLPIETKNNRLCLLLTSKLLHDHWI